jgi:hypothetical protein
MRAMLAIPFRGNGGERERILGKTLELLRNLYNWQHVELFDTKHPVFNRAASRNLGVFSAEQYGCDVVVVCDADSIPEKEPLWAAIHSANDGIIHFPFTSVAEYPADRIHELDSTLSAARTLGTGWYPSQGGCWVATPKAWWEAGGMDERIIHWGPEDRAFLAAYRTLLGDSVRHEGMLVSVSHGDRGRQFDPADVRIMEQYERAFGNRDKMLEVIASRGPVR